MLTPEFLSGSDSLSGIPDGPLVREGVTLDPLTLVSALQEEDPGFHADVIGRRNMWSPRQAELQGLWYWQKHICSMDRCRMPQWPEWTTEETLREVPLDYALRHADFPVVDLPDHGLYTAQDILEGRVEATAQMLVPAIDDVRVVGWAEVVWKILKFGHERIDARWFATELRLPMDWLSKLQGQSPINFTYGEAAERGLVHM